VSWNFLENDGVFNAVSALGGGQDGGRGTFVPYSGGGGRGEVLNNDTTTTSTTRSNHNNNNNNNSRNQNFASSNHRPNASNSTFSNISLSSDEDMDNIPFNGIVNDSAQSVISEISERTGGALLEGNSVVYSYSDDNNTNNNNNNYMSHTDAVKALLREGMESARQKQAASTAPNKTKQQQQQQQGGLSKIREGSATTNSGGGGGGGSNHGGSHSTHTTARSTIDSCNCNNNNNNNNHHHNSNSSKPNKNFLEDIHHTYSKFKTDRNGGKDENGNRSILSSIIEDVQFCGLYFCGIDTTRDNWGDAGHSQTGDDKYDELMKKRREDRKRAADETFLGKVISCGDSYGCGGNGTAFCVSL